MDEKFIYFVYVEQTASQIRSYAYKAMHRNMSEMSELDLFPKLGETLSRSRGHPTNAQHRVFVIESTISWRMKISKVYPSSQKTLRKAEQYYDV